MDLQLADKVCLVTGASGGIGRAMAEAFAAEGAYLCLHGHGKFAELEEWIARQPWSERALAVRADVAHPDEVASIFECAVERWGRVDVCLANAGIWTPGTQLLNEAGEERIRRALEVNLFGAIWTARAFMATLAQAGPRPDGHGASLVFTGSTAGRFGERGHAEYAASKAALYGLVRTLKNEIVELDPYARVNMIEPGWTVTHMARPALDQPGALTGVVQSMSMQQIARAKDIARSALFLASPAASRHITGEVITVAGGMEGRVRWTPDEVDEDRIRARLGDE